MKNHVVTGLHYMHVIPDAWGAYVDIHSCYSELSSRTEWNSVISPKEFEERRAELLQDGSLFLVFWDYAIDPGPKEERKALVTAVYSEAIGSPLNMLQPHVAALERFKEMASRFDALFGHTPWMAEQMAAMGSPGYVLPAGWSPFAMGVPRWNAPKHRDIAFYGSITGRRNALIPYFKQQMPAEFTHIDGHFGRSLIGELERYKSSIYIAHSEVRSFSTWRTWQSLCTSAGMIVESDDTTDVWPMVRNDHFLPIKYIDVSNVDHMIETIRYLIKETDMLGMAKRLYSDLAPLYTVDLCVDNFLVPSSEKVLNARTA